MEDYIQISKLNDFLYSPASLYLHAIYENFTGKIYKKKPQIEGSLNHQSIDNKSYSTRKDVLMAETVYSEELGIVGKIDIYDQKKRELVERKTFIKKIYQGYKVQLWAQYFCLLEMGEKPEKIFLYSIKDNKKYEIDLPGEFEKQYLKNLIKKIRSFNPDDLLDKEVDYYTKISIYGNLAW